MSTFGGLHIGTSAIHAAQRGLDVTGQNIANSATEGYTRQRVNLEAVGGPGVPAFWSKYDGVGEGVKVTSVTRMNDDFLTARARNSNAALGSLEEQAKTMAAIERTVGEPSDTGLQKKLAEMWNAYGQAGNTPTVADSAPRSQALERTKDAAGQLNQMSKATTTQWQDTGSELAANVTDINKMAGDVAKLNEAIRNNDIARVPSNELLDQRDLLISKISTLTGATVQPSQMDKGAGFNSQSVDVVLNGKLLVNGTQASSLKVNDPNGGTYPTTGYAAGNAVGIQWASPAANPDGTAGAAAGESVAIASGRVAGQLQSLNTTIPNFMQQIDKIAQALATTVNDQQSKGYTVDGRKADKGLDIFTSDGTSPAGITAANIQVRTGMVANDIAVSKGDPKGADGSGVKALDGENATAMSRHIGDAIGPDPTNPTGADAAYKAMVVQLGVDTQSVNRNVLVQQNVVTKAEDARDNVSGVSLNEEMTNMIQFQHSFSAAAKFVGVIDQTLDTLINMVR